MITVKNINYPAPGGIEKRRLYIYTPLSYEYEPEKRYPVLYMFDGHNVFYDADSTYGKSWGLGKYLDYTQTELIVVALECNHGENFERLSEYSPYDFEGENTGFIKGRGKETMDYFVYKLRPMINRNYRTLRGRDNTFIGGSSMGGLMALYGILEYNRYFSEAAALSPAIWMNFNEICELIKKSPAADDTLIYIDYGSEEMDFSPDIAEAFGNFGGMLMQKGIALTARIVPGGTHSEASWEKQLPFVISTLLYE